MLRLEAARFNAAEYDDTATAARRRSGAGSPGTRSGSVLVAAISRPPVARATSSSAPATARRRSLRLPVRGRRDGDRARHRVLPLPPAALPGRLVVPGRAAQRGRDRAHRRGRVPRRDLRAAPPDRPRPERRERDPGDPLRPRDAARGARSEPLDARDGAPDRARRRLGDRRHGRDRRGVPRPRVTRFAVFLWTGHAGQFLPRGREVEEIEKKRRPPEGWRVIGPREPASAGPVTPARESPARRRRTARRPSLSTSTSRSASRSARTATSSSSPGRAARGPRNRVGAFLAALAHRDRAPGRRARRDVRRAGTRRAAARLRVPRRRDAVAAAGRRRSRRCSTSSGGGSGSRPSRGHHRGEPRPRRARRCGGAAPRPGSTRISFGAQSLDAAELKRLGRRHRPADVADAVAEARGGRDRVGQRRPALRRARGTVATWMATLDAALDLGPDHLSLYALTLDDPDAEGLTGPGGDHLPTTAGRPALARGRPAGAGRGPGRRPVPPRGRPARRRRAGAATRSRTGPGPATRAATTSRTGSVGRTRRSGRARTRSTAPTGAGTRLGSTATSRRWPAGSGDGRGCRRAARRHSTTTMAAAEAAILGLRLDTGLPLSAGVRAAAGERGSAGRSRPSCSKVTATTGSS